jgi:hypothetical protein
MRAKGPISVAASLYDCCVTRLLRQFPQYTMMMTCEIGPCLAIRVDSDTRAASDHGAWNENRPSVTSCSFYVYLGMPSPRRAIRGRTPKPRLQNTICTEL